LREGAIGFVVSIFGDLIMTASILPILESATLDPIHGWYLTTRMVAEGYGVKPETVRSHKANHSDELLQGLHFLPGTNNQTYWTKVGVIRLGMFISSPQAIAFRNAAETYLSQAIETPVENFNAPVDLDLLASAIADEVLSQQLQDRVTFHLNQKLASRQHLEATLGKLHLPIPRDWPQLNAA
jgi:hypothetical protein